MSHKIMKATLPALALSATAGVAQADVLDDAINDAKGLDLRRMSELVLRKYLAKRKLTD